MHPQFSREREDYAMNSDYIYLCGVMWLNHKSEDGRVELIRALNSNDPNLAWLAYAMLHNRDQNAATKKDMPERTQA